MLERVESESKTDKSSTEIILKNVKNQTKAFELKNKDDKTLVTGAATYTKAFLCGSKEESQIIESLEKFQTKIMDFKVYEYACQFEREKECKRVEQIYKLTLEENNDLWEKVGIVYIDQNKPFKFPKNKVCIQQKYENNLLTFFTLSYEGWQLYRVHFNVEEIEKKLDVIKKNKLEYVNHVQEIAYDAFELSDFWGSEKYVADFNAFLKKWPMINAVVKPAKEGKYYDVEFKDHFNLLKLDCRISNATAEHLLTSNQNNPVPHIIFNETAEQQLPRLMR